VIVLWVWIGAVVVALVVFGIVGYDVIGRVRRFRQANDRLRVERVDPARALIDGIQLTRSSGRHSAELRLEPAGPEHVSE
jgi:hypothetical protein